MGYASFWKRAAAYLVDSLIYSFVGGIITVTVNVFLSIISENNHSVGVALVVLLVSLAVQLTVWAAYYAWPESSSWQATIGKKIFGLRVTDTNGQRISFWRAVWRNFAKFFSTIILGIGYLMCFWTKKKQCLHDIMSDCLVLDEHPENKQGCVVGAIVGFFGLLIVTLFIGILAAISLPQYFKAVERSRAAEALAILSSVSQSQQRYYLQNGNYARTWDKMDMAPSGCSSVKSATCETTYFTYELKRDGISATRIGNSGDNVPKYQLYRSYDTQNGKVQCEPLSESAKFLCSALQ